MTPDEFVNTYRMYLPSISRYLARRVPVDDVEDLASSVFEVAFAKRESVAVGEELPWLYRIAGFQVANFRRRKATASNYLIKALAPDYSPPVDSIAVLDVDLGRALSSLAAIDRELISLVALEGLDVKSAATVLGITPNAASTRLNRIRKKLADNLSVQD